MKKICLALFIAFLVTVAAGCGRSVSSVDNKESAASGASATTSASGTLNGSSKDANTGSAKAATAGESSGATIASDAKDKDVAEEKAAADASKSSGEKASDQTPKHALEDWFGVYSDGTITVDISGMTDDMCYVKVRDLFKDGLDASLVGDSLVVERVLNAEMMMEVENPYDEQTVITLTKGAATEGAFTYQVIHYSRDTTLYFPYLMDGDVQGLYRYETSQADLKRID